MATIKTVKKSLRMAHNDLNSWRKVGEKFGITGAMAFRIAERDYEPKTPGIRVQLDLPAMVDIPACPDCGEVHTKKTCPRTRNGKPQHYVVSVGYIPDDERDPYRQLTPDQRRQAMDNFIKELED